VGGSLTRGKENSCVFGGKHNGDVENISVTGLNFLNREI
jgi:hypothetical protein